MEDKYIMLGVGFGFGAALGFGASYLLLKRRFDKEMAEIVEEYRIKSKAPEAVLIPNEAEAAKDDFEDFDVDRNAISVSPQMAEDLIRFQQEENYADISDEPETEDLPPVNRNVFDTTIQMDEDDYDWILASQQTDIYVIPRDEYDENYRYEKFSFVYWAEDDTVTDEEENLIPSPYDTLGPDALDMFGILSGDNNVVYVRNDKVACDFEVMKRNASYAQVVAGLPPEPTRHSKMRNEDD